MNHKTPKKKWLRWSRKKKKDLNESQNIQTWESLAYPKLETLKKIIIAPNILFEKVKYRMNTICAKMHNNDYHLEDWFFEFSDKTL